MKTPRKQKHYTSEAMVIKDIDAANRKISRLTKKAEEFEATAELLKMADDPQNASDINSSRELANDLRGRVERLRNTRLLKLKNTLAAFRTGSLAGMGVNDVTLQPK